MTRHNNAEFLDTDSYRSEFAGQPFGFKAFLLQIKGDWSEYSLTFGFPSWATELFPCLFCNCIKSNMLTNLGTINLNELPWDEYDHSAYFDACTATEKPIIVNDRKMLLDIRDNLEYDKRLKGFEGRAITASPPAQKMIELGLRTGDRLEPSASLEDVSMIDTIITSSAEDDSVVVMHPSDLAKDLNKSMHKRWSPPKCVQPMVS